jgi:L-seryl-tRNA(Ser) seleniumtransferase
MVQRLTGLPGIAASEVWPEPDPYPCARAKIAVDPQHSGLTAMALSVLLAEGNPTIKTRSHHAEEGYFLIDPFNLSDGDADYICERIEAALRLPDADKAAAVQRLEGLSAADLRQTTGAWPYLDAEGFHTEG